MVKKNNNNNNRYLNTTHKKKKLKQLQMRASIAEKELKKLLERIGQCAERNGLQAQPSLNDDFIEIMEENTAHIEEHFSEGSFRCLF